MKKIIAILLSMALLTSVLSACGSSASSSKTTTAAATTAAATTATTAAATTATTKAAATTAAAAATTAAAGETHKASFKTVTPGVLTVGTSPDFAPYEFYIVQDDGTMQMVGFDVALAQAIADYYGLTLKMQALSFDALLLELQSGTIDLAIAGFSPDPDRLETTDFSNLYYKGGQSFMIRAEDADKYKSYSDFDGKTVEAQTGSIQYTLAEKNTPNAKITGIKAVTTIISDLINGKCEGAYIETAVAESYLKNYPELKIAWEVEYTDAPGSAVAVQKGNTEMLNAVNEVVDLVTKNGQMDQFVAAANELAGSDKAQEISAS